MTEKIIKAVQALDLKNDNHWTADGLPRLETVRMVAGDQSLTRDDVTNAAPGFTRANPVVTGVDAEGKAPQQHDKVELKGDGGISIPGARDIEPDGTLSDVSASGEMTGVTDQETPLSVTTQPNHQDPSTNPAPVTDQPRDPGAPQASNGGDAGSDKEAEQSQVEDRSVDSSSEVSELEEDLASLEEEIREMEASRDKLIDLIAERQKYADEIRDRISTASGSQDNQSAIAQYLEAQKRRMEERADLRQALQESGVNLARLVRDTSKSPLDQALARKATRPKPASGQQKR